MFTSPDGCGFTVPVTLPSSAADGTAPTGHYVVRVYAGVYSAAATLTVEHAPCPGCPAVQLYNDTSLVSPASQTANVIYSLFFDKVCPIAALIQHVYIVVAPFDTYWDSADCRPPNTDTEEPPPTRTYPSRSLLFLVLSGEVWWRNYPDHMAAVFQSGELHARIG